MTYEKQRKLHLQMKCLVNLIYGHKLIQYVCKDSVKNELSRHLPCVKKNRDKLCKQSIVKITCENK